MQVTIGSQSVYIKIASAVCAFSITIKQYIIFKLKIGYSEVLDVHLIESSGLICVNYNYSEKTPNMNL